MKAGTGKADLTPPVGGRMAGYGARGTNVSKGVHDPLYSKALVLGDGETKLAVVTLDLAGISAASTASVREKVKAATGIENVLLVASHTHSAGASQTDFPSKEKPWIKDVEEKIAGTIIAANHNMQPAKIGVAWGEVREGHNRRLVTTEGKVIMLWANRNRRVTAPVDYSMAVIRIDTPDGKPIANLVNFTCHPVVAGPENLDISADYVGVFTKLVEEKLGGQCMFLQGAAGDINPFWDKTPPSEGAFEQMEKMGTNVGNEAVRVSHTVTEFNSEPKIRIKREKVPLGMRRDRGQIGETVPAEINAVLIGKEIAMATFPGEFFVEHGLWLKKNSKFRHTMFVGYTNDHLGYFPTIKAATEGGYGAAIGSRVEVGAGERLAGRALVNLYYLANMINP